MSPSWTARAPLYGLPHSVHIFRCTCTTWPDGFLFVSLPVDLNDVTHRRMVLGVGMSPWRLILKCWRNSRWVLMIDSPVITNVSQANTRWSNDHKGMVATEWHHVESPRPPTPHFYLSYRPSTVHVKTSHLPGRTLYNHTVICVLLSLTQNMWFNCFLVTQL